MNKQIWVRVVLSLQFFGFPLLMLHTIINMTTLQNAWSNMTISNINIHVIIHIFMFWFGYIHMHIDAQIPEKSLNWSSSLEAIWEKAIHIFCLNSSWNIVGQILYKRRIWLCQRRPKTTSPPNSLVCSSMQKALALSEYIELHGQMEEKYKSIYAIDYVLKAKILW